MNWMDHKYKQVFDLIKDPYEEHDIFNSTDPEVLAELRQRLADLFVQAKAGDKL
jgi:hypothetical protein